MDILAQLKTVLVEKFSIDPNAINEHSTFESLELDSLAIMEVLVDVEDKFHIEFEDLSTLKNLGDVVAYIEQHIK